MNRHYIDQIVDKLRKIDDTSTKKLENGTLLICENRNRKPGQFVFRHIFYGPLNDDQIARLEVTVQRKLPTALRDLYRHVNGGDIFQGSFSWQGLREDYSRDPQKWLPISLQYGNIYDRPREGPPGQERFADNSNQVRFGIYVEAAVEVMMHLDGDPKIYAVPRYKIGPVLREWPDLETFFRTETEWMLEKHRTCENTEAAFCAMLPPWFEPPTRLDETSACKPLESKTTLTGWLRKKLGG